MLTVAAAYELFITDRLNRGVKPVTLKWYEVRLRPLLERYGNYPVNTLTLGDLRAYIISLREQAELFASGRSRHPAVPGQRSLWTVRGHVQALRSFFKWVYEESECGLIPAKNPGLRLKSPMPPIRRDNAVDPDVVKKMFVAAGKSQEGIRNRAFLAMLWDTGARLSEVLGLRLADVDMRRRRAMVIGKFDKARYVPFTPITADLIQQWLSIRPKGGSNLFCSLGNTPGKPLTMSGVYWMIRRLKKKAGLEDDTRANPHAFRHGFARQFRRAGGNLWDLKEILGHTHIDITIGFYAVADEERIAKIHEQFSPMRNLDET